MPEVLEPIGTCAESSGQPKREYLFNKGNARELSRKALEARQRLQAERANRLSELEAKEVRLAAILDVPNVEQRLTAPVEPPNEQAEELELVREQLVLTRSVLNDKTPYCKHCERPELQPHHRAQLLRSLDALLDRKRELSGRPKLSASKASTGRPKRGQSTEPLYESSPTPAPLEPKPPMWSDY